MPVIPTIETRPSAVPTTAGSQPRAHVDISGFPTYPTAAVEALQSTVQAGNRLADFGQQFADKYIAAKMHVAAADETAQLSTQLNDAEFQSSKIPDRDAATADYNSRADKIWEGFTQKDVHPLVRASVEQKFLTERAGRLAQTQHASFQLWASTDRGKMVTDLDSWTRKAADAPSEVITQQMIQNGWASIDARVAGGTLAPDVAARMKLDFESNVYRTKIELAMAQDSATGLATLKTYEGKLRPDDRRAMIHLGQDRQLDLDAEARTRQMLGTGLTPSIQGVFQDIKAVVPGASISSGFRPGQGEHGKGNAIDIPTAGMSPDEQAAIIQKAMNDPRVGGIGHEGDHIHIDVRQGKSIWGPDKKTMSGVPPAISAAMKDWAATPRAQPSIEQIEINAANVLQQIQDSNVDPRVKARMFSQVGQQVMAKRMLYGAQHKQLADDSQAASIRMAMGTSTPGTAAPIADGWRALGDKTQTEIWDNIAKNEKLFADFMKATPSEQAVMVPLMPGLGGEILRGQMTGNRLDRQVIREEARRMEDEAKKLLNDPAAPWQAAHNAIRDAVTGYLAAGTPADLAKAEAIRQDFVGAIEGKKAGAGPRPQAEALRAEIEERFQGGGHTRAETAMWRTLQQGITHTEQTRKTDPIRLPVPGFGPLVPFNWGASPDQQAMQMQDRTARATAVDNAHFGGVGMPVAVALTHAEIADKLQQLRLNPQTAPAEIQRLATIAPKEQIIPLAKAIAGDGHDLMASAISEAMMQFKAGEIELARSVLRGADIATTSGREGAQRMKLGPDFATYVTNVIGPARAAAGWAGDAIARQDNAILARYVDLMSGKDAGMTDSAKLEQAVRDIAGEVSSTGHGAVLLPKGISNSDFYYAVSNVAPEQVPPLRPAQDGRPITLSRIQAEAIYVTVGSGIYRVRMKDPSDGIVRDLVRLDGNPWVINIRDWTAKLTPANRAPR